MKRLGWIFLLAVGVLLTACDRAVLPYVPAEEEPPPPSRPVRIPGLENPAPRARRPAPVPAGRSIRGTLRLDPGVAAPGTGVLFVIALTKCQSVSSHRQHDMVVCNDFAVSAHVVDNTRLLVEYGNSTCHATVRC